MNQMQFWYRFVVRFLYGFVLLFALAHCSAPNLETESPELKLLRANGFQLPSETQVETLLEVSNETGTYRVLRYRVSNIEGIQIAVKDELVSDPEIAFPILLTLAWHEKENRVTAKELGLLEEARAQLDQTQERYAPVFQLAKELEPILRAVDKLRDRPLNGPRIEIKGFSLLEINDLWDALCAIPVDATTACLLEPVLREIHTQGLEIEQLVSAANSDLGALLVMLEAQAQGQVQDGLRLKQASDKALSSLANLRRKLQDLDLKILTAQDLNRALIEGIKHRQWGMVSQKLLDALKHLDPSFDIQTVTDDLVSQLEKLDQKLEQAHARISTLDNELQTRMDLLERGRQKTDERARALGRAWRARPTP